MTILFPAGRFMILVQDAVPPVMGTVAQSVVPPRKKVTVPEGDALPAPVTDAVNDIELPAAIVTGDAVKATVGFALLTITVLEPLALL